MSCHNGHYFFQVSFPREDDLFKIHIVLAVLYSLTWVCFSETGYAENEQKQTKPEFFRHLFWKSLFEGTFLCEDDFCPLLHTVGAGGNNRKRAAGPRGG